ncbi:MAG: DNA-binding response regulator [Paenibacillus sp.]|nr:DNA-binding response regulator [Paenibacillus sp.]
MTTVLIVDDDPHIREAMILHLRSEGFDMLEASNGLEALRFLEERRIDLVVLDIMMPEMDGWEFCRRLREERDTPVLMVTAKGESSHKVRGFLLGTDDYLVKPFDPVELVLRVRALLRRYRITASQSIRIGQVELDRKRAEVTVGGKQVALPPKEFELLFMLASYPRQIFTRAQLIEKIWGFDFEGDDRTVDVHIKRLRERFAEVADDFQIATVYGLGYRLEVCK